MDDILFNEINAEILSHLNIHEFYAKYIPNYQRGKENFCPFHVEKNPSFRVFDDGGYNCKGCPAQGAGPVHFYAMVHGYGKERYFEAQAELYYDYVERYVLPSAIEEVTGNMTDELYERLERECGYKRETLEHFRIGWSKNGERLAIPITNRFGYVSTLMLYNVFRSTNGKGEPYPKMQPSLSGQPTGLLWPLGMTKRKEPLVMCEGEGDTLSALSAGLPAFTVGGAMNRIRGADLMFLKEKEIYVAYDNDEAGKAGAKRVLEQLFNLKVTDKVHIIRFPEEGQDLKAYLLKEGLEAFKELMEQTPLSEPQIPVLLRSGIVREKEKTDVPFLPLFDVIKEENFGQLIQTEATVIGRDAQTVVFPRRIKVQCKRPKKKCAGGPCPLAGDFRHEYTFDLDKEDPFILRFAEQSDSTCTRLVREMLGLTQSCAITVEVVRGYTALKILVTPVIKHRTETKAESTTLMLFAYYFAPVVNMNLPYIFQGYAHRHPKDSTTVGMFTSAQPVALSVDHLQVDEELREKLTPFRAPETEDLFDYLMRYYQHCADSITLIRGRPLTHMAADLVFFSPVSFYFEDQFVRKASLDAIIFGDPRCGKNQIAEGLMRYYEHGEVISGENISLMNIIGGIQAISKYRGPCWGRIAMRNRDTVIIDEMSALPQEEIGRLSRLRYHGLAEISKLGYNVKTDALTGILWLSNPRDNRMLSAHHHCIEILRELAGHPADMARWDYAHAVAVQDVPSAEINRRYKRDKHKYTQEQYHQLILWCKSRKPEDIEFTEGAVEEIFAAALELASRYHPKGALVQGENVREKVAKIAAAIAGKLWSADPRGEKMIVDDRHVRCAVRFLRELYDNQVMGYLTFSNKEWEYEHVDEELLDSVIHKVAMERDMKKEDIAKILLAYDHLTDNHFQTFLGLDYINRDVFKNVLGKARAIEIKWKHYVKTKAFKEYLERRLKYGFSERN